MAKDKVIKALNDALEIEYGAIIQYWQNAEFVTGLNAEPIVERLKELASDEVEHAEKLRERLVALGATPSVKCAEIKQSRDTKAILEIALAEEEKAVRDYAAIISMVKEDREMDEDYRLKYVLYEIISEEQQHIEEIKRLLGK